MFSKSRKSAAIISLLTILMALFGHFSVLIGLDRIVRRSSLPNEGLPALPVVFLANFLVMVIALLGGWSLARFIFQQDESHFGRSGAARWSLTGLLFGGMMGGTLHLGSYPQLEILESLSFGLALLEMVLAYALVFQLPRAFVSVRKRLSEL